MCLRISHPTCSGLVKAAPIKEKPQDLTDYLTVEEICNFAQGKEKF